MAVRSLCLSTQLKNKLNDENVLFDDRMEVAKTVFISTTIPILQKEDFILECLLSNFNTSNDTLSKEKILKTIYSCLKSRRMKIFGGIIRPSVVINLLEIMCSIDDNSEFKGILLDCIIEVLESRYFQRLFASDVVRVCKIVGNFFNNASKDSKEVCIKAIALFLYINKMTLLKEDMRIHFILETFIPMCSAWTVVGDDEKFTFRSKIITCILQVVFFENSFLNALLYKYVAGPSSENSHQELILAISKIKALPTECSAQVVSSCYTFILRAAIAKIKQPQEEYYKRLFKVFELFSEQMGLTVDKVVSVSIGPIRGWEMNSSFMVISEMIKVLDEGKIPLQLEFEGYTLESWMISVVIGMSRINLSDLPSPLLDMVETAFRLNPLIIEPCIEVISSIMLRSKPEASRQSYIRMMLAAIDGTQKVKRLQKFISLILLNIRSTLLVFGNKPLTIEDVIPLEVGEAFSDAVETLPNTQSLSTMKALLYHLELDTVSHVESSCTDITVVVNTEIIAELFNRLLNGVKFADHSVPEIVKAKFKSQLEDLQNLLKKLCEAYLMNGHNDRLMRSFLQLCHTCGEINLLFEEYDGSPLRPLESFDELPTNLAYVHPYLTAVQWGKIFKDVVSHDGCLAKHRLMSLLIQKISAVSQVEVGAEGPGSQAARYLLEIADIEWMWSHLVAVAPLFQAMELNNLIKSLVNSGKSDQSKWKTLITENGDKFLEDRRLVLATGLRLMYKAGRILGNSSERSLTYLVMSHLMIDELLEYELSQLIREDEEEAQILDNTLLNMANLVKTNVSVKKETNVSGKIPHESYFEVLEMLPLHHFSITSQSSILLSIVSLLYDLPPQQSIDNVLLNSLLMITDGPQKNNYKLFGHLDPSVLIKFLATRAKSYTHQKELISKLCNVALSNRNTAKQLLKFASKCTKDTLWITTIVIQALKKIKRIGRQKEESDEDCDEETSPRKKDLNKKESITELVEIVTPILLDEIPSPELITVYAVILKCELANKNEKHLQRLFTKLSEYSEIAIRNYTSCGSELVEVMMSHRQELSNYFPKCLINLAWTHLLKESRTNSPSEAVCTLVFSSSNQEEFNDIITQLLSETLLEIENVINGKECNGLEMVLTLWGHLVLQHLPYEKSRLRSEGISRLVPPFIDLINSWSQDSESLKSVKHVLSFFSNIILQLSIELKPVVIDTILLSLGAISLDDDNKELVISRLGLITDTLFSLYLFRTSSVLDRLPAILQRYRNCLFVLAPIAAPSIENVDPVLSIALKLERVATRMVKRAKDFSRIAPYIIADIVNIIGKFQMHVDVKKIYTNIINAFLPICDSHAITYLQSVQPLASKELFKNILVTFNKHHRYVGKI